MKDHKDNTNHDDPNAHRVSPPIPIPANRVTSTPGLTSNRMEVRLQSIDGALRRLLDEVRQHGLDVITLHGSPDNSSDSFTARLYFIDARDRSMLIPRLRCLHEVIEVDLDPEDRMDEPVQMYITSADVA